MPAPVSHLFRQNKPLFRPEALREVAGFRLNEDQEMARSKLKQWAERLREGAVEKMKETELLPVFITDIFEGLLGYQNAISGAKFTLKREALVKVDGKRADAGFGRFSKDDDSFVAVLEGKGPLDPLDRPFAGRRLSAVEQAREYAGQLQIDWYLVTNLHEIRLYHKGRDTFTYEVFETQRLAGDNDAELRRFVFLLAAERVIGLHGKNQLDALLTESARLGHELTNDFYAEYRLLREHTFNDLKLANPKASLDKLLKSTQKLLDRVLFIAFSEDRGLLPREIIAQTYAHRDEYNPQTVWQNFVALFKWVDKGNDRKDVWPFNGGLFAEDAFLDSLAIPDSVCARFKTLADYEYGYNFASEAKLVDVEILGHIFEQSITDLEELQRRLKEGPEAVPAKGPTKRKKEGAFYTPDFITRYIVAETLGPTLRERFELLRQKHEHAAGDHDTRGTLANPTVFNRDKLKKKLLDALAGFWHDWREELKAIRICDPACGSGAFLVEAFDQMAAEYARAQSYLTELEGPSMYDVRKTILTNNLFGMDLNAEAIEIARLSCWIKTAEKGKTLTTLDENIKQGNSIVGQPNPLAAWQRHFPDAFKHGGFDVVIGNPPYVRQEWIKEDKPYLQEHYRAYDGVADLYVYFYELGLAILKPGGRLGLIVTNKWLKAGYAEALRGHLGGTAWIESVIDFGHAKQIFPDADVFPSILVARKPCTLTSPPPRRFTGLRNPPRTIANRRPVPADRNRGLPRSPRPLWQRAVEPRASGRGKVDGEDSRCGDSTQRVRGHRASVRNKDRLQRRLSHR